MNRLWDKVDKTKDGCWEWRGVTTRVGYGVISVKCKKWSTHRLAYTLTHGEIPAGMLVCHKCDNRKCINPDHLFLGTVKDNALDAARKGRLSYSKPKKIAADKCNEIVTLLTAGSSYGEIAVAFNVSRQSIANFVARHKLGHKTRGVKRFIVAR